MTFQLPILWFQLLEILNEGKSISEEMVVQLILDRLKSPEVEHYGNSTNFASLIDIVSLFLNP